MRCPVHPAVWFERGEGAPLVAVGEPKIETLSSMTQGYFKPLLSASNVKKLTENKLPPSGVCWPEFADLDWAGAGLRIIARSANGDDKVGITGTYCALAENGTLMLLSGQDTHATTSLLPDNHIAIVPASRIVRGMEDGWDLLRRERSSLPRQVNFISGPSRTADIEMTMVLGVHGPFRVHVIIVS